MPNTSSNEMQRRANWLQIVQNTVDQYDDPIHGVQKDAIQNGKDAILPSGRKKDGTLKKDYVKNNWKFSFELGEIKPRGKTPVKALIMTDFGTTGLMGDKRVADFGPDEEIPLEERWARFESYAMANEGGQTLGARGQGKFVFVAASNEKKIIYDTRTADGKYRAGYTTVTVGTSPVYAWNGKEGERWIRDEVGLTPVHSKGGSGTRIIIVDPKEELIVRLKSGAFLEHIRETWWPFIRDFDAHIEVTVDGVTSIASVPDLIKKISNGRDSADAKFWNKDGLEFKFGQWAGRKYKIKEFRIASITAGNLPEAYRGIAVFRGCMKVQAVQPLYGYDFEGRITGYVILDSNGDEKLREVEKPSHYEFNNSGIWKKIETIIKEQAQRFGAEKLGIGVTGPVNPEERRQASVSKALQIFRFLSKDWPLELTGGGGSGTGGGGGGGLIKNRYVSIKDFVFPNPANVARFDWGQAASGWWLEVSNRKSPGIDILLECWVSTPSNKLFEVANEKMSLASDSVASLKNGESGFSFPISKDIFPAVGEYQLRARISDIKTKKIIDEVTRRFWVQTDPPLRAPFDMQPAAFSTIETLSNEVDLEWKLEFREDGNIVWYNIDHPSFIAASRQNEDSIFLGELAGMAGMQLVIRNINTMSAEEANSKKLPFKYDVLFGNDPEARYLETIKMRDRIRHKILSNYLT